MSASHDAIGDFLTILRNALRAQKESCATSWSRQRAEIARILKDEGYVSNTQEAKSPEGHRQLVVTLKYVDGAPAITGLQRLSSPGRRLYYGYQEIPRVLGGLGVAILTTSRGLMKDAEARRQKIGGELLCKVW
jgi:small subunit ribosomal protein S8